MRGEHGGPEFKKFVNLLLGKFCLGKQKFCKLKANP